MTLPAVPTTSTASELLVVMNGLVLLLVAVGGLWLAGRQMVIAQQRLQHDVFYRLFDMRFEVYKATREFLARGYNEDHISETEIGLYRLRTLEARFLFKDDNDEMAKYLSEICQRVTIWQHAKSELEQMPNGQEDGGLMQMKVASQDWIRAQGDDHAGFQTKFDRFLVPREVKLPRWLSWPAPGV
jgi:hypothetical protein